MILRKFIAFAILLCILGTLTAIFWWTEVKYLLPTPVPQGYVEVPAASVICKDSSLASNRPAFYHFFTTNCPCSRFNLDHFNSLKRNYGDSIDFYVVVPHEDDLSKAAGYFDGDTRLIKDINQELALKLGVYSTPQAVILKPDCSLYFRGNYNKARYCTDPMSNFAQMALDSLRHGAQPPQFGPLASIAYGCGISYF